MKVAKIKDLKKLKSKKFYALCYYDNITGEEVRICVDKSKDYLYKLLDVFVTGGKKRSSFRIVEFTSKKNTCLQYIIDDFLLEV